MAGKKNGKVEVKGNNNGGVKYTEPSMGYMSSKSELVIKETCIKMREIFGEEILCKNDVVMLCKDYLGLYLTGKNNIDVPLLDGYRMYQRDKYTIEEDGENYKIICNEKEWII